MAPTTAPPVGAPAGSTRRGFLGWMSRALLGLWGAGAAGAVLAYLRAPEKEHRIAERTVRVGPLEDLRIGEARFVRHGTTPFFVVRTDAGRVVALSAVCTHVRCILGFDREKRAIVCPCHDGRFDLAGNVLSGPPPRPLRSYEAAVRAGEVYVRL
jgi:cytochrome b6-f complex iron-sulfur subunit